MFRLHIGKFYPALILFLGFNQMVMAGDVYLGFTAGPTKASDTSNFQNPKGGYYGYIGYQTESIVGFEYGTSGISEFIGTDEVTFLASSYTALATIPIGPVLVFARAGLTRWNIYVNDVAQDNGSAFTYGAGFDIYLDKNFGLRFEWQRYEGIGATDFDIDHSRFGVRYRF